MQLRQKAVSDVQMLASMGCNAVQMRVCFQSIFSNLNKIKTLSLAKAEGLERRSSACKRGMQRRANESKFVWCFDFNSNTFSIISAQAEGNARRASARQRDMQRRANECLFTV